MICHSQRANLLVGKHITFAPRHACSRFWTLFLWRLMLIYEWIASWLIWQQVARVAGESGKVKSMIGSNYLLISLSCGGFRLRAAGALVQLAAYVCLVTRHIYKTVCMCQHMTEHYKAHIFYLSLTRNKSSGQPVFSYHESWPIVVQCLFRTVNPMCQ